MSDRSCSLCGHHGQDVRVNLVEWKDQARPFAAVLRCVDAQACRYRLELIGDEWPVNDSTVPTVRPPDPDQADIDRASFEEVL
ncbi:MAG TPA: hypothetical protein VFI34_07510 [Candidatus Limnocylindrales bacterium]|nr:hypothetical protein [Candidatus Limnocylindrales bacterium]